MIWQAIVAYGAVAGSAYYCGKFMRRIPDKTCISRQSCARLFCSYSAFKYLSNHATVRSIASMRSSRFANP
jgi:hypothetical protein